MILIADHCIFAPVLQALSALKFPIRRVKDLQTETPDYTVMQACLDNDGILLTLDAGIPSQAYAFEYAKHGLSVVLLRWKSQTEKAWQQMTEVILRDNESWYEIAGNEPSVISVSYRRCRSRAWSQISPQIVGHAFTKEVSPPHLDS